MGNERYEQLLDYLDQKRDWVAARDLARYFGVSGRQIRSYVAAINRESETQPLIDSSNKGYRLSRAPVPAPDRLRLSEDSLPILPAQRNEHIIAALLRSPRGCNVFDLAESLFISIPTLENDLGKIRRDTAGYSLILRRNRETVSLEGSERDKRRFLKECLFQGSWEKVRTEPHPFFSQDFNDSSVRTSIKRIFSEHSVFVNDYALDDLLLHMFIVVQRVRSGCCIEEIPTCPSEPDSRYLYAIKDLSEYLQTTFSLSFGPLELHDLELVLSQNTSILDPSVITPQNLKQYVEQEYIEAARYIVEQVKEHYLVNGFSDDFFVKFTLHLKNLFIRSSKNLTAKNPLKDKIKWTYPLIHDISVFIADILDHRFGLHIDEDEIAYIAFHLCTCLYGMNQEPVTATFIYANYYDYHQKTVELLEKYFEGSLAVKFTVSIHDYIPTACHSDLIISTVGSRLPKPCIVINPFPLKQDFEQIRNQVEEISRLKKYAFFHQKFLQFFAPQCFICNRTDQNPQDLIRTMCRNAIDLGFARETFTQEVLRRERMSNTAFHEVAVPHAMSQHVNRSFISVSVNRPPVRWSENAPAVKLVLMIGIHEDDRRIFSRIFDFLVEILSAAGNVALLEKAASFEEFTSLIGEMAGNVSWD